MNNKSHILTILFIAAVPLSCVEIGNGADRELTLSPFVGAMTKSSSGEMPHDRVLNVSARYNAPDGTSADYFPFTEFAYSSATGEWSSGCRYWPPHGTLDMLSYSCESIVPASVTVTGTEASGAVLVIPDNYALQDDILAGAVARANRNAAIEFQHTQTRVSVRSSSQLEDGVILAVVRMDSLYWGGTLTLTRTGSRVTSDWSEFTDRKDRNLLTSAVTVTSETTPVSDPVVLPPQPSCRFYVKYMLDGPTGGIPLYFSFENEMDWEAGRQYNYDIEFIAGKIVVTASVTDFMDGGLRGNVGVKVFEVGSYSVNL